MNTQFPIVFILLTLGCGEKEIVTTEITAAPPTVESSIEPTLIIAQKELFFDQDSLDHRKIETAINLILREKPAYLKALYDGYYYMSQAVDNENNAQRVSSKRIPVFTRKGDTVQGYYISQVGQRAIDHGGVSYNPVEDDARQEIQRVAERPGVAFEFLLEPGDLLLVNNRTLMHARRDYADFPEIDRRRHLFRLWMATPPEMMAKTFSAPSDRTYANAKT